MRYRTLDNQPRSVKRLQPFAIAVACLLVGSAAGVAGADTVAISGLTQAQASSSSANAVAVFAMPPADSLASSFGRGIAINDISVGAEAAGFVNCGLAAGSVLGRSIIAIDLSGLDPNELPIAQTLRDPSSPLSGRPFNLFDSEQTLPITPEVEIDSDVVRDPPIVPLPPAAWAGLSTLVLGAGVGIVRRRRIARA